MATTVEIAIQDIGSAKTAFSCGAGRVEVCAALEVGGVTPSFGLIEQVGELGSAAVLIRPRAGDFEYSSDEVETARRDVVMAVKAGATGVVIGALRGSALDLETLRRLSEAALETRPDVEIAIHRCVDVVLSQSGTPESLAEDLAQVPGLRRVLTSGGAQSAGDGSAVLSRLVGLIPGEILAGGGLKIPDIPDLYRAGVRQFHLSARRPVTGGPTGPGGGAASYQITDAELVKQAVQLAADTETKAMAGGKA